MPTARFLRIQQHLGPVYILCYPSRDSDGLRFRRYHSMLFGQTLAVTAFNRLPFLLQAILQRCFALLCSFFFDDATFQDWQSCATCSQELVAHVMRLVGCFFAAAKREGPSTVTSWPWSMISAFSTIISEQRIQVSIRARLQAKIHDFIPTAKQSNQLHPGTAAKLYGCVTFLDQAVFGKIARARLNAPKGRQYLDHETYLTAELHRSFSTILAFLSLEPRRIIFLSFAAQFHISGGSDAAQDTHIGSGGFLLGNLSASCWQRLGAVVRMSSNYANLVKFLLPNFSCLWYCKHFLRFQKSFVDVLVFGTLTTLLR